MLKLNQSANKTMNRINPKKLLNSQWTAVQPVNKERHFIVTKITTDDGGEVISCLLEAIISKRSTDMAWHELQDNEIWLHGWK